jgi:DMSO/TMAO reductase YedYZ molybdopterin-dependent catalytic subunit
MVQRTLTETPLDKIDREHLRGVLEENGASLQDLDTYDEYMSRRGFFGRTGALAALAGLGVGAEAALQRLFGQGLIPVAWGAAETEEGGPQEIPGKPGMIVHNTRPLNGEFPPHLLDDDVTPSARHFVRCNGLIPERATRQDPQGWTLTIDGEVHKPLTLTLQDLQSMPSVTHSLLVECGGNGRAHFDPPVRGNPWDRGAVGCSEWTGVPLRELLKRAGIKDSAVYTGHYGEDPPLGQEEPFSRGIPIEKALEEHTLVAYKMNGQDLPALNGYPARLVVPGWIASCSQKWLTRIWVRNQVHDSKKMKGYSYRIPRYPVVPGSKPPESDMVIATAWIIKSMITQPAANTRLEPGTPVKVRGHAWAGEDQVESVYVSTDYGRHWEKAVLQRPANRYAWYGFETTVSFPDQGYYEIWARAEDDKGNTQPARQPWNPKGYLSNVIHRLPVLVAV